MPAGEGLDLFSSTVSHLFYSRLMSLGKGVETAAIGSTPRVTFSVSCGLIFVRKLAHSQRRN
jgi:hypothetical protein